MFSKSAEQPPHHCSLVFTLRKHRWHGIRLDEKRADDAVLVLPGEDEVTVVKRDLVRHAHAGREAFLRRSAPPPCLASSHPSCTPHTAPIAKRSFVFPARERSIDICTPIDGVCVLRRRCKSGVTASRVSLMTCVTALWRSRSWSRASRLDAHLPVPRCHVTGREPSNCPPPVPRKSVRRRARGRAVDSP